MQCGAPRSMSSRGPTASSAPSHPLRSRLPRSRGSTVLESCGDPKAPSRCLVTIQMSCGIAASPAVPRVAPPVSTAGTHPAPRISESPSIAHSDHRVAPIISFADLRLLEPLPHPEVPQPPAGPPDLSGLPAVSLGVWRFLLPVRLVAQGVPGHFCGPIPAHPRAVPVRATGFTHGDRRRVGSRPRAVPPGAVRSGVARGAGARMGAWTDLCRDPSAVRENRGSAACPRWPERP